MTDIEALTVRRSEAEERLRELKDARAVTVLAGADVGEGAEIARCEALIEGIDAAIAEAIRRERAASQAEYEAKRASLVVELEKVADQRLKAIADAEKGARAFAAAAEAVRAADARLTALVRSITGRTPRDFMDIEWENLMAERLSCVLLGIGRKSSRMGRLDLVPGAFPKPDASWVEIERPRTDTLIAKLKETA